MKPSSPIILQSDRAIPQQQDIRFFVGQVIKESPRKANPGEVNKMLVEKIKKKCLHLIQDGDEDRYDR